MKRERRIPAWLLRDLPALAGMFVCFWLFVILLITEGFRIIRGGKPSQDKFDRLADPLLAAEATLPYALCREAYRRLGYNPKLVRLDLADLPTDSIVLIALIALMARIRSYMDQPGAEPLARLSTLHRHPAPVLDRLISARAPWFDARA